jgi:integrase
MHKRGLCEPPNRDRLKEPLPPLPRPSLDLPGYADELALLRFLHRMRDTPVVAGNWRRARRYRVAWTILAVVRGLGCRPSEAYALTWHSVAADFNTVRFYDSKTGKDRRVPVVLEWVRQALAEAHARPNVSADSPVCANVIGRPFSEESTPAHLIRDLSADHAADFPKVRWKQMQKLQIAHLIRLGFPPHVVARWSDHTLSVQERHYYEDTSYLPPEVAQDYGEFGVLSEYGKRVREHLGSFSRDLTV